VVVRGGMTRVEEGGGGGEEESKVEGIPAQSLRAFFTFCLFSVSGREETEESPAQSSKADSTFALLSASETV